MITLKMNNKEFEELKYIVESYLLINDDVLSNDEKNRYSKLLVSFELQTAKALKK